MAKLSSTDKPVTKAELQEFYQQIFPYLGGNKAIDSSPIGTVISYMGATPPAGYLACDGSKLSATAFLSLFDVLKTLPSATRATWGDADWVTEFNVPNLQGEFLRGSGTNSHTGQGSGSIVGTHQDATQVPNTSYSYTGKTSITKLATTSSTAYVTNYDTLNGTVEGQITSSVGTSATSTGTNAYFTTRPTNTSVLYCIKYMYATQTVNYSENEQIVGTWVDGSAIYEKTFVSTMPNVVTDKTEASQTLPVGSHIDKIVSLDALKYTSNNDGISKLPYQADAEGYYANIYAYTNNKSYELQRNGITIFSNKASWSGQTVQIIIRYTKTTD